QEDVPYIDLTTETLGIGNLVGTIHYRTRHKTVLSCVEEAVRILEKTGVKVDFYLPSGTEVSEGKEFLRGTGSAASLHVAWRVSQILLEYACGIATATAALVSKAKSVNPDVEVVTTRKNFPFGKKIAVKSVIAGGGFPHRLGLSETVLVFEQHVKFLGGFDRFLEKIDTLKRRLPEKRITVEVETVDDAEKAIDAGADIVQLDKFSVDDVKMVVAYRDKRDKNIKVACAGGINGENVKEFVSAGADIIVTSCVYFAEPADIKVWMEVV
ncbi:ModD protein, partial [Desulfurobacterium sp.]